MSDSEYIYGYHSVKALIESQSESIEQLFLQKGREDERLQTIAKQAEDAGVAVVRLSKHELDEKLGKGALHQGVVAACRGMEGFNESALPSLISDLSTPVLLLILDGVQDPHNLGACLRSANAFGVNAVIAPKDRAVGLTPVVKKVASGAASVTPFIQVTNLSRTMKWLKDEGVWLVGTGDNNDSDLSAIDLTGNIAIVMGAEGQGMRRLTRDNCDYLARIPTQGTVESLNVSVATGVSLYEVNRQRKN